MIKSKADYYDYLEADRLANNKKSIHANFFGDYTFNYLNLMRKRIVKRELLLNYIKSIYPFDISK